MAGLTPPEVPQIASNQPSSSVPIESKPLISQTLEEKRPLISSTPKELQPIITQTKLERDPLFPLVQERNLETPVMPHTDLKNLAPADEQKILKESLAQLNIRDPALKKHMEKAINEDTLTETAPEKKRGIAGIPIIGGVLAVLGLILKKVLGPLWGGNRTQSAET